MVDPLQQIADGDGTPDAERIVKALLASGADPSGVILDELSPVKDQGAEAGLCACCALTSAVEHALMAQAINQAFGAPKAPINIVLDERFVDYLLRRDRGDMSGGAMLGEVARAIGRYGICRQGLYSGGEPSAEAYADAATRIIAIVPFLSPGKPAAEDAVASLQRKVPVAVGLPIDNAFKAYRPSGWEVGGSLAGSAGSGGKGAGSAVYRRWHEGKVFDAPEHIVDDHAALLCGWRRRDDAFLVRSSWGTSWGMGGYAWISRSYLTMWGAAGFCYAVAP